MNWIYHILDKIKDNSLAFLVMTLSFFAPIGGILLAVGFFIVLDTVVGVWKARKIKQEITSRRFSSIVVKFLVYQLSVMTFFVMDFFILNDIIKNFFTGEFLVTKIMALILIGIEFFSIDESFKKVKGVGLIETLKKIIKGWRDVKDNIDKVKRGDE